jgi:hypothetical protein
VSYWFLYMASKPDGRRVGSEFAGFYPLAEGPYGMADENVFAAFGAMFQEPDDEFQDPRDPGSYGGSLSAVRLFARLSGKSTILTGLGV